VLVPQEVDELFASLRELTAEGATILFISHKLDEVLAIRRRDHGDASRARRAHRRPEERHRRQLAELIRQRAPGAELRDSTVTDTVQLSCRTSPSGVRTRGPW